MAVPIKQALSETGVSAAKPSYDRETTGIGIVHLGPGAFFRAHQAVYTDDALGQTGGDWGICAVSLRSADARDALVPQDGLYTLATLDRETSFRVIGSIKEVMVAPEDPAAVIERMADLAVKIVTLTITEKGYCLSPDGSLNTDNADIAHDLDHPDTPKSAIGFIVAAQAKRHAAGTPPLTCISCDNLPDNGIKLKNAVIGFAAKRDKALADWISGNAAFPRTMVDSITPATTEDLIERVASQADIEDAWPIQREAFTQWVIENFDGDRPDWEGAGATFTGDVDKFEHAKLKLLNGPHSALAYLGPLGGHETVREAVEDDAYESFITVMTTRETIPGLTAPEGLDLVDYRDAIIERFHNPEIRHKLSQIAWDGTQKLPVRIISTIRENIEKGLPIEAHCLVLAGWRLFVVKALEEGREIVDPLADELAAMEWSDGGDAAIDAQRFCAFRPLIDEALGKEDAFSIELTKAIAALGAGSPETVRSVLSQYGSRA